MTRSLLSIFLLLTVATTLPAAQVGDVVTLANKANVRTEPRIDPTTWIQERTSGSGVILAIQAGTDSLGNPLDWWQVDFAEGADGWVGANNFIVVIPPAEAGDPQVPYFRLTWQDNSSDESEFRIERTLGDGVASPGWSQIAVVAAGVTTYVDDALAHATTYAYRVRAYRAADNALSGYTNIASGTTPPEDLPPLADPSGLGVEPSPSGLVTLTLTPGTRVLVRAAAP